MTNPLVWLRSLQKSYRGITVLDIDELVLGPGHVLALTGPNGAGKSTLLRIMGLLEQPDTIEVFRIFGVGPRPSDAAALRRRIGVIFQEPFLFKGSVGQNISLGLRWRGFSAEEIDYRIGTFCELLGLDDLEKPARELSRGQAQRLALARALALEPELLLLDEPLNALDVSVRSQLLKNLKPLLTADGRSTVFVTHSHDEAERLADERLELADGKRFPLRSVSEAASVSR